MRWALDQLAREAPNRKSWQEYRAGNQPTILPTERIPVRFINLFHRYRKNLAPRVVANVTDRLHVEGWTVDGEQAQATADEVWWQSAGDTLQQRVHDDALTTGDAFVLVWPDEDGTPRVWEHPCTSVTVTYDDRDEIAAAAKVWQEPDGTWRLTEYLPDQIIRWRADGQQSSSLPSADAWTAHDADDEPHEDTNPFGEVPWAHFPSPDGRSILEDVAPLQDQLNLLSLAMIYATAEHALPPRWVIGAQPVIDPETGRKEPPFHADDRIWGQPPGEQGETRSFGQFEPGDIRQIQELRSATVDDVAEVTGQPAWTLRMPTGEWPSGEALRSALGPLVKQVEWLQRFWKPAWSRVMRLALLQAGHSDAQPDPVWADVVQITDEQRWARVQQLLDLGFPLGMALKRGAGWTQDQVDELLAAQADDDQRLGQELRRAATNGGDPAALLA